MEVYDHLRLQVGDYGHKAWSLSDQDGYYGQMLASRFPLSDQEVHDISLPGREPRKALEARVQLPSHSIRVIATHLGLRQRERRQQIGQLREIILAKVGMPTILLGDFNEWRRIRPWSHGLADLFDAWTTQASFPSRFPILPLDRIWCRPGTLLANSRTVKEAHMASDHLPVVAQLNLLSHDGFTE